MFPPSFSIPFSAWVGLRYYLERMRVRETSRLTPESTNYAKALIDDYAARTEQTVAAWKSMNGQQGGDPGKLAEALVKLAGQDEPPLRWAAGADAIETFERKAHTFIVARVRYRL